MISIRHYLKDETYYTNAEHIKLVESIVPITDVEAELAIATIVMTLHLEALHRIKNIHKAFSEFASIHVEVRKEMRGIDDDFTLKEAYKRYRGIG